MGGVADPKKHAPTNFYSFRSNISAPKILGCCDTFPLEWEAWLTLRNTHHMLPWRTWSFCDKGCGQNWRTPKLGSAGPLPIVVGCDWHPRNTPLPTRVILPNLVILGLMIWALSKRSTRKFDSSHFTFQGHSRSSKLTWVDWLAMTYC